MSRLTKAVKKIKLKIRGLSGGRWRDKDEHFWLIVRWETGDLEGMHSIITTFAQRKQTERFSVVNSFPRGSAGYAEARRAITTQYYGR